MAYDEIIDPRQLRNALITGLERSAQRLSRLAAPASAAGIAPCMHADMRQCRSRVRAWWPPWSGGMERPGDVRHYSSLIG